MLLNLSPSPDINEPGPAPQAYRRVFRAASLPHVTSATQTGVREEVAVATEEDVDTPWRVVLYNDAIHTFDEVIHQLVRATGCSTSDAESIAWTVHTQGKALAFEGSFPECFRVQGVLKEIQLVTEIQG